jgi:hypothetical protein
LTTRLVPGRTASVEIALRRARAEAQDQSIRPGKRSGRAVHLGVPALSRKLPSLVAAFALLLTLPGLAVAKTDHATLIDVHAIQISHAKPGSGTANCSNDGAAHGQFALTGWAVASSGQTAHLNLNTVPGNLNRTSVASAMQAGFSAWSGAPRITVATNGTVTKYTANHSYDLLFARTGGGSIAVTYTWQWSDGSIESDTVFNNRLPWAIINATADGCNEAVAAYDVANIATHEFGHTYGLDHASSDRFETMYPYGYTGETLKRTPANGDQAGINAVY